MVEDEIPAGWYPDPDDNGVSQRYWDGDDWTEQTRPTSRPRPAVDSRDQSEEPQPVGAPQYGSAPTGASQFGAAQQPGMQPSPAHFQPRGYAPGYDPGFGGYPQGEARNGLGTAGLVLGILAVVLGLIPLLFFASYALAPLAIVFGAIGISRAGKRLATNRGAAIAAVVLGIIGLIAAIAWTAAWGKAANDINKSLPKTTVSNAPNGNEKNISNLPLGQTATITSDSDTTEVTVQQQSRQGGQIAILVTYSCTAGTCDYNELDWNLRSADGTTHNVTFGDNFGPSLNSGTLNAGSKAQGWVVFEAPPGSFTAEYTGNPFGAPATWKLP